jgi:multifunctional methyltransferase subunit TRM112
LTILTPFPPTLYMRLITHNLLACHAARPSAPCTAPNNFPLTFQDVTRLETIETDLNPEFLRNIMHKIDYAALVGAARQVRPFVLT